MVQIAPSMLSADFLHLEHDVETVNSHADLFHLDIMDGVFVPNISYGFPVVEAIASKAARPMDAHLMIVHPEKYVERFAKTGVAMLSAHLEAMEALVEKFGGNIVGRATVLAEGDAADRDDIIFLESLPLFPK